MSISVCVYIDRVCLYQISSLQLAYTVKQFRLVFDVSLTLASPSDASPLRVTTFDNMCVTFSTSPPYSSLPVESDSVSRAAVRLPGLPCAIWSI